VFTKRSRQWCQWDFAEVDEILEKTPLMPYDLVRMAKGNRQELMRGEIMSWMMERLPRTLRLSTAIS
jgi:hypothetical protein